MALLSLWLIILCLVSAVFPWSAPSDVKVEDVAFKDYHDLWHGYRKSPILAPHLEIRNMAQHGNEHMKRWYGMEQLGSGATQASGNVQPWPVTCTTPEIIQTLKYCYVDERSHKNLEKIIAQSTAK
ncbi:hypothetical protein CLAFUR0_02684 [Fulvia fulva]|nr:hypothetical protein CLAFUR0_02684 [Fulvia fulva]